MILRKLINFSTSNSVRIAVIVPSGFARSFDSEQQAQIAVLTDGSEPISAQLGQSYATALNARYVQQLACECADRQGFDLSQAGEIEPRLRTWYNPERQVVQLPDPGPHGGHHHDRHPATDRGHVRPRTRAGTREQMTVSPLRQVS